MALEPDEPDEPDDDGGDCGDCGDCNCDELPLLLPDPDPVELPAEPLPFDPLTGPPEPELVEPDWVEAERADPLEWLAEDVAWVEPGSSLAIPRAPAALTTPTPTVSADSRVIPRLRSSAADLRDWSG